MSSSKGKERFFWQYNVQAKGPKGKRLVFQSKAEDPHVLNEVTDPVFSPTCSVRGIKVYKVGVTFLGYMNIILILCLFVQHSGKARKGDGNDLTPNARKLHNIGRELDKLSRTINDMTPVSELPFNVRPKSRKEKNKLASRACRLKKKAQHEANKIKLFGLEIEHSTSHKVVSHYRSDILTVFYIYLERLINGLAELKQALALKHRTKGQGESTEEMDQQIQRIYTTASCKTFALLYLKFMVTDYWLIFRFLFLTAGIRIAGGSTDFVNKVLENMRGGMPNGGLEELRKS